MATLGGVHSAMTAHRASTPSASSKMTTKESEPKEGSDGGEHSELHPHGDGTYHTVVAGQETEHPHLHHALMHMAGHHEPGDHHMAVHHTPGAMNVTSHHTMGDGQVKGPHDHANAEALKDHFDKFMNEEETEGHSGAQEDGEPAMSGGEMY